MWPTGTSSHNEPPKMTSQSFIKFTEDESRCELGLLVELA